MAMSPGVTSFSSRLPIEIRDRRKPGYLSPPSLRVTVYGTWHRDPQGLGHGALQCSRNPNALCPEI